MSDISKYRLAPHALALILVSMILGVPSTHAQAGGPPQCGGVSFTAPPGSPFVTGLQSSYSLAVGDFNADGKPDLATPDGVSLPSKVAVLLGDGAGGFNHAPGSPLTLDGGIANDIVTGDFNLDGKLDLATADYTDPAQVFVGRVSVLLGDGTGGFTPSAGSPFPVSPGPYSIAVADFNQDGNPDVSTSGWDGVTVLLGDGAGGLAPAPGSPFLVGYAESVDAGDVNLDGKLDLMAVGNTDVTVLLGDGAGGFSPLPTMTVVIGGYTNWVGLGDFNLDGKPDMAVTHFFFDSSDISKSEVVVLTGDGAGGFSPAPGSAFPAGSVSTSFKVADFNLDGGPDLALAAEWDGAVTILLNGCSRADSTPPSITPTVAGTVGGDGWYVSDVQVSWSVTDAESAISSQAGCDTTTVTADTAGITFTCSATSAGGTGSESVTIRRDATAPALVLPAVVEQAASSVSGGVVNYGVVTASDGLDPAVTAATCTPPSGSTFDLGETTVTCTATDAAGNTTAGSFTVKVIYSWSDVLQPVNADGSSIFKLGSTVPVKFQLTGASAPVTDAVARLYVSKITDGVLGSEAEATLTASATSGNVFRYDPTSGQYVFNWRTKGPTGGTYELRIDLGDGVAHAVNVSLK